MNNAGSFNGFSITSNICQTSIKAKLIFLCLILTSSASGMGFRPVLNKKVDTLIEVAKMVSDFKYLRQCLENTHPSLYRYRSKDSIDSDFNQTATQLVRPMSGIEFWTILQHFVAKIGSGHTYLEPGISFEKSFEQKTHYHFPFHIYMNGNRILIKDRNDYKDHLYANGDEVLQINNIGRNELVKTLRGLISGDGTTHSYQNYRLERGDLEKLFDYEYGIGKTVFLRIKSRTGIVEHTFDAVLSSTRSSKTPEEGSIPPINDLGGQYLGGASDMSDSAAHVLYFPSGIPNTSILKINAFTYRDYVEFHNHICDELEKRKVQDLLIDIRNNPGGDDFVCIDLLRHLMGSPFRFTLKDEGVVTDPAMKEYLPSSTKAADRKVATFLYPANNLQSVYNNRFKGKIHLLINGGTFSAAALFTVVLKQRLFCNVYGSETGGGAAGCDGGRFLTVILPNSKIRLHLPLLWTYSANELPLTGKGVLPDRPFPSFWLDTDYNMVGSFIKSERE